MSEDPRNNMALGYRPGAFPSLEERGIRAETCACGCVTLSKAIDDASLTSPGTLIEDPVDLTPVRVMATVDLPLTVEWHLSLWGRLRVLFTGRIFATSWFKRIGTGGQLCLNIDYSDPKGKRKGER